jgi:Mg2+-importing ATPase
MTGKGIPFWSIEQGKVLEILSTTLSGLTGEEARARIASVQGRLLKSRHRTATLVLLATQFKNPIVLILIFASLLAFFLHDTVNAVIVLSIVFISGLLSFWQEKGARDAMEKLLRLVEVKACVLRDGVYSEVPVDEVVPGDIIELSAGATIPGDSLILHSKDLFVNEAALTGETFPVEKTPGVLPEDTPLARRTNSLFMGTHVVSGSALAVVVYVGRDTEFGRVSERLKYSPPETEFERGIRRFGYLLLEVTLLLVLAIFAINVFLARPVIDAFLFSLAIAVGLTPQLLPAIISVNLAHGAKKMSQKKVIVKRLASIENFGSMNVLCSDKTGTVTEGVLRLESALSALGEKSEGVMRQAYINAYFESGYANPIDQAIRASVSFDLAGCTKLDEVPYDFLRKRLSILVREGGRNLMITKGAVPSVLGVCSLVETAPGVVVGMEEMRERLEDEYDALSEAGFRTLGVAVRVMDKDSIGREDEREMTFLGFLTFTDPPKEGILETIGELKGLGIGLKIITGDGAHVARSVWRKMGLSDPAVLTGQELRRLSDEALLNMASRIDIFAELEPNQKERIILALRKAGNVVGYLGDGINDASALHAADVGVSVEEGVDVAKEASDIVLMTHDLGVLIDGVREGRKTFINTLKYVFMATSANFGNMFSMAGASLFLPFLPLLPKQILLTNLLTDLPEMTIATDNVDREMVRAPRRWNIRFIRNFMVVFGLISSVFDYLTFGVLLFLLGASTTEFRTGWFVESVVSASTVVLVIRTQKPFFLSKPSPYLALTTVLVVAVTLLLPWSPLAGVFSLQPLPALYYYVLIGITALYVLTAEVAKVFFFRNNRNSL